MIKGFHEILESSGQPGLVELRDALRHIFSGAVGQVVIEKQLKPRVHRIQVEANGRLESLVVKRFDSSLAQRNQLVMQRWLPAIGLDQACPRLLGIAAERKGQCVWHIYEDLGEWELKTDDPDRRRVIAVVELIAQLHMRAAGHFLLPECRKYGDEFGPHYFASNLRDAICALESLELPDGELSPSQVRLRDRLLDRVYRLRDESPTRTQAMAELAGPDTLLHGDLWNTNTLVLRTPRGLQARLIDWDHAGVGPISYDLSTFLYRFHPLDRPWIVEYYQGSVERAKWRLPSVRDLNLLFDTAECARYANCIAWTAIALQQEGAGWGFDKLAEIERWFGSLEPVLPEADAGPSPTRPSLR